MGGSSSATNYELISTTSNPFSNLYSWIYHRRSSSRSAKVSNVPSSDSLNVQDEARSFRANIGAVRLILRNEATRESFNKLLESKGKQDYANKFYLLDVMRKEIFEKASASKLDDPLLSYQIPGHLYFISSSDLTVKNSIQHILNSIHKLSSGNSVSHRHWLKTIAFVQDQLISYLFEEFEALLLSKEFQSAKTAKNTENSFFVESDATLQSPSEELITLRQVSFPSIPIPNMGHAKIFAS
jgi:hypothetical protein